MEFNKRVINILTHFNISFNAREITDAEKREKAKRPIAPIEAVNVQYFFG